jgi:heme exporter protein B
MISVFSLFKRQFKRETLLQIRELRQSVNAVLFFLMIIVFFPLTLPVSASLLRSVTPGLIWIAILFALFLSAERLFIQEYEDGVIEQWLVSGLPVSVLVLAKICVQWLVNTLPIVIVSPILAILLKLNLYETMLLNISIICGTPAIVALCAMSSAFSTGLKQKGVVMALILLPLVIPILILGSAAISQALHNLPVLGFLALLLAISCVSIALLPFAIASIIKISLVD